MADITRTSTAVWDGPLTTGSGTFTVGSGAIPQQAVSWAARTEAPNGKTSPEELLAAAHASCFAMAFSATLGRNEAPPEQLTVTSVVTFAPKEGGGFRVASSALTVRGKVPGIDQARFEDLAKQGEAGCPVSNALRGNVDITVEAILES